MDIAQVRHNAHEDMLLSGEKESWDGVIHANTK